MKRVIVGLSGGVDSSVAAYLLKEQGYEVIGLFMKNWHDDSVTISDECPWLDDSNDAMLVADKLGIPFQTVDLSEQYKERIVDYMFDEYQKGRTPNPDVLCNREIKFDVFMKIALDLGADFVATGHYCRKGVLQKDGHDIYQLLAGVDPNKDQSYFLCQLSQDQLSKALFPIGELTKPEVRKIAAEQDLITADKKDSQGLCFIGKVRLPEFLQQKLQPKEGVIVEIVRPGTGDPVADGEVGELVVTTLNPDYPLIRFGTGDLSAILPGICPTGRTNARIKGWMGRADQTVKVRGMFVHPGQVADIAQRFPEVLKARLVVSGEMANDSMTFQVETAEPIPSDPAHAGLGQRIGEVIRDVTKLRGTVQLLAPGSLPNDGKVIEDARSYK